MVADSVALAAVREANKWRFELNRDLQQYEEGEAV